MKHVDSGGITFFYSILRRIKESRFLFIAFFVCGITLYCCDGKKKEGIKGQALPETTLKRVLSKPTIDVYVENSGSMDGYVKGVTEFEQIVYNYLTDIKISGITDSLNLFYINSKPILYGSDISDFIEKLEPTTFAQRGGDRGTTDLSAVIDTILKSTNDSVVSILVSDCIFSPGKGVDAQNYLINQQIGLKRGVADYADKHHDVGVMAYRFLSRFKGTYFNRVDAKQYIDGERPFFIWLIGKREYLSSLLQKVPDSKFKGNGVQQRYATMAGNIGVKYAIKLGSGKFHLDKENPQTSIVDAEKDKNGNFTCTVEVDFSTIPLSNDYLCDVQNYIIDGEKDYSISRITTLPPSSKYTHAMYISSNKVKPASLTISLEKRLPNWIDEVNDDGGDMLTKATMDKTFGIKYLYEGIYEAFTIENDICAMMKISINK